MAFDADRVFHRIFPVAKSPPGELIKRITTFFKREMSYDKDVLDALAGIFAEFRDRPRMSKEKVRRGSIITAYCDTPNVPLDRVDTLYGLPLYQKQAFEKQYDLSSTATLVLALCWSISGAVLRRKDLPSWSWAGWKADLRPERKQLYRYSHEMSFGTLDGLINRQGWMSADNPPPVAFPVSIEVSTVDGSWTNWEENWQDIVANPDVSEKAKALKIRGWTCRLRLERKESKWKLCYPEKFDDSGYNLKYIDEMDLGLPSQDGCTLSLKALVVYIDPPSKLSILPRDENRQGVKVLVLREVQAGTFERVGSRSHTFQGGELSYGTGLHGFKAEGIDFQLEALVIV
jgi:hypothetical protein